MAHGEKHREDQSSSARPCGRNWLVECKTDAEKKDRGSFLSVHLFYLLIFVYKFSARSREKICNILLSIFELRTNELYDYERKDNMQKFSYGQLNGKFLFCKSDKNNLLKTDVYLSNCKRLLCNQI